MQVGRWGNSLAVRLPSALVEALELKPGDEIQIRIDNGRDIALGRKSDRAALIERLRTFRSLLPPEIVFEDFVFDGVEANER